MAARPYNSEFDGRSQTEHGGIPNSLGVIRIIWIDGPAGGMSYILKHRLNHPSRLDLGLIGYLKHRLVVANWDWRVCKILNVKIKLLGGVGDPGIRERNPKLIVRA